LIAAHPNTGYTNNAATEEEITAYLSTLTSTPWAWEVFHVKYTSKYWGRNVAPKCPQP